MGGEREGGLGESRAQTTLTRRAVERAPRLDGTPEDVGVDLRSLEAGVAEEILDGSDVGPIFQKMGCEGVAE